MTKYEFTVTIGATAVNLAAAAFAGTAGIAYPNGWTGAYGTAFLLAAKISIEVAGGATGQVYVGNASVSSAGANADFQLAPGTGGAPGQSRTIESQTDSNILDLAQYWIHGSNSTDKVTISYYQE